MSFVNSDGIMSLVEDLLSTTLAQTVPHLKITPPPFPRMNHKTAIEKVLEILVCIPCILTYISIVVQKRQA